MVKSLRELEELEELQIDSAKAREASKIAILEMQRVSEQSIQGITKNNLPCGLNPFFFVIW